MLLALLFSLPASAQDVVVRSTLNPVEGAVVGQPVRLLIDVLFPDAMPRPPRVRIGDAGGAQIMRFETQAVTIREDIEGRVYVGQRFEFVVFPRRGGVIDIAAADVTLLDTAGDASGSAHGQKLSLPISVPDGVNASGPVIAASKVVVSESWSPDPSGPLKPGSAITRTIRREAPDVPALGMSDLAFDAPEGVRVYVDPPQADDRVNRGIVEGSRVDKATYVFERAGDYQIPDVIQPWFDLGARQARIETLAGVRVSVVAPPGGASGSTRLLAIAAAMLAIGGALVWTSRGRLAAWRTARRRRLAAAEATARKNLQRIAVLGDAGDTYRALRLWLDRTPAGGDAMARLDVQLGPMVTGLERAVFGVGGRWLKEDGVRLGAVVSAYQFRPAGQSRRKDALPPLNPPDASRAVRTVTAVVRKR